MFTEHMLYHLPGELPVNRPDAFVSEDAAYALYQASIMPLDTSSGLQDTMMG